MNVFCSGNLGSYSSMFNPTTLFVLEGSNKTTSFILSLGTFPNILSIRSPCGSITPTPSPDIMSCSIKLEIKFDFPVPVCPITYKCLLRSDAFILISLLSSLYLLIPISKPSLGILEGAEDFFAFNMITLGLSIEGEGK